MLRYSLIQYSEDKGLKISNLTKIMGSLRNAHLSFRKGVHFATTYITIG